MDATILRRYAPTPPLSGVARSGDGSAVSRWRQALETGAFVVVAGGLCVLAQGPNWRHDPTLAVVNLRVSLLFVFAGSLLRRDTGQRGVGWALILAGIFRSVDFIDAWNGPWPAYALVFGGVDRVFGAWALLRYPNPRLSRRQRDYLWLLAGWMLIGRALIAVTSTAADNGGPPSWWWPSLLPDERVAGVLSYVVGAGEAALGVALIAALVIRLVRTQGLDRVVLTPVMAAGVAAVIAAIVSASAMTIDGLTGTANSAFMTESLVDVAVPLAFLLAVVQRTLLLRNITALASRVRSGADVGEVRHALRGMLRDPTLDLVDISGGGQVPADSERLVETIRTEAGTPIAVVIADPALARYRGVFDAAVSTSGLALRNAQLQAAAAREKLEQARASRARVIEAEAAERRRLERDLHDGVQQHLLSVTARLAATMNATSDPGVSAALGEAAAALTQVLAELRDLAHGIHPASLSRGGLRAALEAAAERLPLPVRVTVPASRLPEAVELTLYFVACEALANVVKHAAASGATVTVREHGALAWMEIADDGAGGVTAAVAGDGHGLGNILDRVRALDGDVAIDSPPGDGTRLEVTIPCG